MTFLTASFFFSFLSLLSSAFSSNISPAHIEENQKRQLILLLQTWHMSFSDNKNKNKVFSMYKYEVNCKGCLILFKHLRACTEHILDLILLCVQCSLWFKYVRLQINMQNCQTINYFHALYILTCKHVCLNLVSSCEEPSLVLLKWEKKEVLNQTWNSETAGSLMHSSCPIWFRKQPQLFNCYFH